MLPEWITTSRQPDKLVKALLVAWGFIEAMQDGPYHAQADKIAEQIEELGK